MILIDYNKAQGYTSTITSWKNSVAPYWQRNVCEIRSGPMSKKFEGESIHEKEESPVDEYVK